MAKKGRVQASLQGLALLGATLAAVKGGRVDVGFFAGKAARGPETVAKAAARARRVAKATGAGSKPGFYKQGIAYAQNREKLAERTEEPADNPSLAAKHEFGVGVPRRSMLRVPLHLHGDKVLKDARADVRATLKDLGRDSHRTAARLLARVGVGAENLVQEAFETEGFGTWKPNAPLTVALKGSDAPLIDTGEMRRAVDSRAVL